MSFNEILQRAKRTKAGLPPDVPPPKRQAQPAKPAKPAAVPLAIPVVEADTPPPEPPEPPKPTELPKPPKPPAPPAPPKPPKPPEPDFVSAARARLSTARSGVRVHLFAPSLEGASNPHDLSPLLERALKQPQLRAAGWVAAPPKRAVGDALDLGLVLSAQSGTGAVAHLGFDERPYAEGARGAQWKALVDAMAEWRATNGKPGTNPFGVVEKCRGGFNSVLGFKPRANAADAADLQAKLPAPLRQAGGGVDVAAALVRVPLASTKSTSRAEITDASVALLDAAQCGFGVDVHALVPLYSLRKSASDRPDSPARTTYETISVQRMAGSGDLSRFLLNLATASQPSLGRPGLDDRVGVMKTLREVFSSLKQCIFGYSMRRMLFFDGSPSNFVVDTGARGASVRVVDLDPLEYRRLHVACAEEPGAWRPWILERDDEAAEPTDAVLGRCGGDGADGEEPDGSLAAPIPPRLQLCAGQGWRPLFLLNSLFTLCMLRHRLASVAAVPGSFWHASIYTRELCALLTRIRNEIPHVGTLQSGFGRVVPPRRLYGHGFRAEDRTAAFAADDENKRVSDAFAADELATASASERAEFSAAAKIVQHARWTGSLQPSASQVTRAGRETHSPDKLGATISCMFQYYSLPYVINETCKLTTDVLLAEFAKSGGVSNLNPATNPRVAAAVTAYRNYRQYTFPFLCFFARSLVPTSMEATHAPLFVDVALDYCSASQETLNRCCVDKNGKPIVLVTAEEFLRRFCAEPRTTFASRERILVILGIDKLVFGTSRFDSLQ